MYASERQAAITSVISADGRAGVSQLAERFEVTTETIRRDLDVLERAGLIRRVHGGAVAPDRASVFERSVGQRTDLARSAKARIAQAALPFVPADSGSALLLDAGTTVGALAELLLDWRGERPEDALPVITHSVTAAALLLRSPSIDLHLLGGRVRHVTDAAVGPTTVEQLSRLRPDVALIGTNGISAGAGLTTPAEAEAAVKTAMVRAARRVVVLADSSKFEEETLVVFASLADIDVLVTDAEPPAQLARALADADVDVVVA